jgi:hypothetical protein
MHKIWAKSTQGWNERDSDTVLGTETKNNVKIIQFLKLTNFYNAIKKV